MYATHITCIFSESGALSKIAYHKDGFLALDPESTDFINENSGVDWAALQILDVTSTRMVRLMTEDKNDAAFDASKQFLRFNNLPRLIKGYKANFYTNISN